MLAGFIHAACRRAAASSSVPLHDLDRRSPAAAPAHASRRTMEADGRGCGSWRDCGDLAKVAVLAGPVCGGRGTVDSCGLAMLRDPLTIGAGA